MNINDLKKLAKTVVNDKISLNKLENVIFSMRDCDPDVALTPNQIYELVFKLDLFFSKNTPKAKQIAPPSALINALRKLVIKEITNRDLKENHSGKEFGFDNAVLALTSAGIDGILTERNFIDLIGKGPAIIITLEVFDSLQKIHFLNDENRKKIIDSFSVLSIMNAVIIRDIFDILIQDKCLNEANFISILDNPYKKWNIAQGDAIVYLAKHEMHNKYMDHILQFAEDADEFVTKLFFLQGTSRWKLINTMLDSNPNNAFSLVRDFYEHFEYPIRSRVIADHPYYDEKEVSEEVSFIIQSVSPASKLVSKPLSPQNEESKKSDPPSLVENKELKKSDSNKYSNPHLFFTSQPEKKPKSDARNVCHRLSRCIVL